MTQHCPLAVRSVSPVIIAASCFLPTLFILRAVVLFCLLPPLTPPLTIQCCWESFPSAMWEVISILAISTSVRMSSPGDEQFFLTCRTLLSLTNAGCIWHRWGVPVLAPTQTEVEGLLHSAGLPCSSVTHPQSCCFYQVDVLPASSPLGWGEQPSIPEGSSPATSCSCQQRGIPPRTAGAELGPSCQIFCNTSEIFLMLWGLKLII